MKRFFMKHDNDVFLEYSYYVNIYKCTSIFARALGYFLACTLKKCPSAGMMGTMNECFSPAVLGFISSKL